MRSFAKGVPPVRNILRSFFVSQLIVLSSYMISEAQMTYGNRTPSGGGQILNLFKTPPPAEQPPYSMGANPARSRQPVARSQPSSIRSAGYSAPKQQPQNASYSRYKQVRYYPQTDVELMDEVLGQDSTGTAEIYDDSEETVPDVEYATDVEEYGEDHNEYADGGEYIQDDSFEDGCCETDPHGISGSYAGRAGCGIVDQNPSPEPFPGANGINTHPNTDYHCGSSLLGSFGCGGYSPKFGTIGNVYNPCFDPCSNPCPPRGPCTAATLFDAGQGFLTGWVNAGATFSPNDNNFPIRYNDRGNEFLMNQLYLSAGRMVNKNRPRFDVGGRVDLLYGTDYFYTSALGWETETYRTDAYGTEYPVSDPTDATLKWNDNSGDRRNGTASLYGLSIPQLYAEFFLPIHNGMTVKAGHFYSIMGYESVMAPQNFFYSRSLTTTYGEPTTFTGVIVSQQLTHGLSVHGGVTRGWDVWDASDSEASGIIGVQWDTCCESSIAFTLQTGKVAATDDHTRTNYSLVFAQQLNPTWKYVIQHDLGTETNASYAINGDNVIYSDATWVSLVQYLECQWTPRCSFGMRFEWFQDDGLSRILRFPTNSVYANGVAKWTGRNFYDVSLGMKWKPLEYLTIRPEVRWDWSDAKLTSTIPGVPSLPGVYDNFSSKNQCTASIDMILMF